MHPTPSACARLRAAPRFSVSLSAEEGVLAGKAPTRHSEGSFTSESFREITLGMVPIQRFRKEVAAVKRYRVHTYSNGGIGAGWWCVEASAHAASSSPPCSLTHFRTSRTALRGSSPSSTRPSRIAILAHASPYCAWKCGGLWSPWYIQMTIP